MKSTYKNILYTIAGSCIGLALILLLTMPRNRYPPDYVRSEVCMSNQRQIALSIQMYLQDHDGRIPAKWSGLASFGKLLAHETYICPTRNRKQRGMESGYGFNAFLLGETVLDNYTNPEKILLTADAVRPDILLHSMNDIDRTHHRHGTRCIASFLDGHIETIKSDTVIELDPARARHVIRH